MEYLDIVDENGAHTRCFAFFRPLLSCYCFPA